MSTKSNVRLSPGGILSPSPCSSHFQKRLQNLAYGSLPSADLSRWHLKPIPVSSPISNLKSSIRLIPQRSLQLLQMASISPFPHYQSNGECKFSGVLECSIIFYLHVTKGNHLLDNQPKLGFGISQIKMNFQHFLWSSCLLICFKDSPGQVSSFTSQVSSDNCSDG